MRLLPICDDRFLDWPFLAYDVRRVLRLVRPSMEVVRRHAPRVEVTRAGTLQLLGIYEAVDAMSSREDVPVYKTEAGYEIVRLVCWSRVAWRHAESAGRGRSFNLLTTGCT